MQNTYLAYFLLAFLFFWFLGGIVHLYGGHLVTHLVTGVALTKRDFACIFAPLAGGYHRLFSPFATTNHRPAAPPPPPPPALYPQSRHTCVRPTLVVS